MAKSEERRAKRTYLAAAPPPRTPPHKGEEGLLAWVLGSASPKWVHRQSPSSPLWGGVRGGGSHLFAIRYSLFAIRYSPFAFRHSLFAIRHSLFTPPTPRAAS